MTSRKYISSVGEEKTLTLYDHSIAVGRSESCDLLLDSNFVSSSHARLFRKEGKVFVADLNSHNGTYVNGLRIKEAEIRDGDTITFADLSFTFRDKQMGQVVYMDDEIQKDTKLIQKDVQDSILVKTILQGSEKGIAEAVKASSLESELLIFYKVVEAIYAALSVKEMSQSILKLILDAIPAQQGYLLLLEEGNLVPIAILVRDRNVSESSPITLSRTIANKAIKTKSTLLVKNSLADGTIDPSLSIIHFNILSALCAPIWMNENVMGIIYLDDRTMENKFTSRHMDLLSAIGYQAAIGIDRLHLLERIRKEEIVRNNLERFHSPEVVDLIIQQSEKVGDISIEPVEQEVTILFSDIVGFTKLAEQFSPTDVANFLNEFLSLMTEIVFEYKGTLDKYLGDGIMAIFGAPVKRADDAIRAVHAAIQMREQLKQFMNYSDRIMKCGVRIGINTGRVVAGSIGSYKRMDYTVVGDAVNVAQRLEGNSKEDAILIGENTHTLVKEYFACEYNGLIEVRNRRQPVKTWWVKDKIPRLDSGL